MKPLVYVLATLLLLGGLYAWVIAPRLAPRAAAFKTVGSLPASELPKISVQYARPNFFDVVAQKGKLLSASPIKVQQGDDVVLHIAVDVPDRFAIEGYNLAVDVVPDKSAVLQFKASNLGKFALQLQRSGQQLGTLEVTAKQTP